MSIRHSYKIFSIFGITINIDISWFFALILVTFSLAEGFYPHLYPNLPSYQYWITALISAISLFICVLLHELSHSVVAIKNGIPVRDIYLFIFGGVAMIEREPNSPITEFKVAIAGPLMSFFLGLIFFAIAYVYPYDNLFNGFINYLFFVNFMLGFFNLVPAFPLDGGHILRSILWAKKGLIKATYISSKFGTYFGWLLIIFGVLSIISGAFISGLWLIFLGIFIKRASKQAYLNTKIAMLLSKYRVDNFLTTMTPIFSTEPIENYLKIYFPYYKTYIYPVISKDGKIKFVYYEDIKNLPSYELENKTAADFERDFNPTVDPSDSLINAYRLMIKNNLSEIPAVYNNTFVGILKRDIIEEILNRYLEGQNEDFGYRR